MPTSTFTITTGSNDGRAVTWTGINTSLTTGLMTANTDIGAWFRFPSITIPQSATITAATLKLQMSKLGSVPTAVIRVDSRSNPPNPTIPSLVWSPSNVLATTYSKTVPGGGKYNLDITAMIQSLVNSYNYDNDPIVCYLKPTGATVSPPALIVNFYDNPTPGSRPELVIDFTAGSGREPDKTSYRYG
jgi:hypothetical protein